MSVFVLVPCYFDYCSCVVLSEVWKDYASSFVLFSQDCFGNSGSFVWKPMSWSLCFPPGQIYHQWISFKHFVWFTLLLIFVLSWISEIAVVFATYLDDLFYGHSEKIVFHQQLLLFGFSGMILLILWVLFISYSKSRHNYYKNSPMFSYPFKMSHFSYLFEDPNLRFHHFHLT